MKRELQPVSRTAPSETASEIALPWIVRLRYGMVLAQVATIVVAAFVFRMDIPLGWMALGPLLVGINNWSLAKRASHADSERRRRTSARVAWAFVVDTLCLTGLIMLSGGPSNPFTLLYLVHITLAATILTRQQTWALGALSIICFGLMFWMHRPVPALAMHSHESGVNLHLIGMWISFTIAVFLVALYAAKISGLLREHEDYMRRMQDELSKKDRLASLATLAAGAAHELGTPLGTIAVVAKELERLASSTLHDHAIAEDSRLIRQEVDRCRRILLRMSDQGAAPVGEAFERVNVGQILDNVVREFTPGRIRVHVDTRGTSLLVPRHAVEQALMAVVRNGLEASTADPRVEIRVQTVDSMVKLVISDAGDGMSAETLRRIGEPFFTTKEPGKGMGLGVFLARMVVENLGGSLTYRSAPGTGTEATIKLPMSPEPTSVASGVVTA
jgi:two-component system sensor histidine kinase RegB